MKFPQEHIEKGTRTLSGGQQSDIFYNGESVMADPLYMSLILEEIPSSAHYIGIATGGLIMAMKANFFRTGSLFSYVHDNRLYGTSPEGDYILLDDVVTTGGSLNRALGIIGKKPREIIVLYDRREINENPRVRSIFR